ncbi:hypothetical protein ACTTAF_16310 [Rhodobacter capsulatus]|uniref:hypothetical protein n=1 Tax=Rhodobacter capsulatus TaxID=1061 RepID=UPI0003D2A1C0|nr:hypothetical protein [Rhodobacter capsulatus]ETD83884.1 hypothetical protein U703_07065 [Rhodobacter capsulatus YW1]
MNGHLAQYFEAFSPFNDQIKGLGFSLLLALIMYLFRARVKLIYGRANNSLNIVPVPEVGPTPNLPSQSTEVYVEKFFLQNLGRSPATNVEFVLSDFPNDVRVWEPRDVEYKNVERGHCLIKIPQIAPGELVVIDAVYLNKRAAFVASVKCAEAIAKPVEFWTLRKMPSWFNVGVIVLVILGVAMVFQTALTLLGGK